MERSSKLKSKILKLLLYKRSVNTNSFKSHVGRRFSGPLVLTEDESYGANGPTSPKVSCIGQIKCKNMNKHEQKSLNKLDHVKNTKKSSSTKKLVSAKPKRMSSCDDASYCDLKEGLPDRAPSLSQMKRFASGRDPLLNFDCRAPIDADHWSYSDEEMGTSDREEEEVIIPFSAPILIGGGGGGGGGVTLLPRKEVNLWKRRTIAPPRPIQVHTPLVRAH